MATDYDAPRSAPDEIDDGDTILGSFAGRHAGAGPAEQEPDETDLNEALVFPGADLSALSEGQLSVAIDALRDDEFVCSRCFLAHHRRRSAGLLNGRHLCRDCS